MTRLTSGSAIDTTPSYAPDGSRIVFNSTAAVAAALCDERRRRDAKRISFGAGKYGTPIWLPRGDLIAFTKIEGGTFAYR